MALKNPKVLPLYQRTKSQVENLKHTYQSSAGFITIVLSRQAIDQNNIKRYMKQNNFDMWAITLLKHLLAFSLC